MDTKTSNKTTYKLTYFDFRWLAEPIRYLLSYVGEEFQEARFDWYDWVGGKTDKSGYRYAKLPILEEWIRNQDGSATMVTSLSQSFGTLKYLGKKYDLVGRNLLEEAKCDEISDCIKDILKEVEEGFNINEDRKRWSKLRSTILTLTIPRYFSVFEEELKAKKNTTGMLPLVGDKITWIDFLLAHWSEEFDRFFLNKIYLPEEDAVDCHGSFLDAYPMIREHQEWVNGLKGVREWRGKRPDTRI